jgi:hypothetical protein
MSISMLGAILKNSETGRIGTLFALFLVTDGICKIYDTPTGT